MTAKTHPAYTYACGLRDGTIECGRYVKKQASLFCTIFEGNDPDWVVDRRRLTKIGKLLKMMVMPNGPKAGQTVYEATTGYQWTLYAATLCVVSRKKISLSVKNNGTSSVLTLSYDGTTLSSQNVEITGFVTFSSLSTSGQSTINGGNITTGTIGSAAGNTQYNLDEGWIRTGTASGAHVLINSTTIRWFIDADTPTGMFHSLSGRTYIGANSRYTMFGWLPNYAPSFYPSAGGPTSEFVGMYVDNAEGLIHCCATKFEIPGRIECASLSVNGREI